MRGMFSFNMIFKSKRGSTPLIIICSALIVVAASAIVTDVGYVAIEQFRLARSVEEIVNFGAEELSNNRDRAESIIKKYAINRINDLNRLDVRIPDNHKELTVYISKPFRYIFLKSLGYTGKEIAAQATARLSAVSSTKGVRPIAVEKQNFHFGKKYILSDFKGNMKGNTSFIPLEFSGGNYEENIIFGYGKNLSVGDSVQALTRITNEITVDSLKTLIKKCKHEPECKYDKFEEDCTRIIIVPIIDKIKAQENKNMKVVGFAAFFLENMEIEKDHVLLTGRFIKHTINANTSDAVESFGLTGIKMLR